MCGCTGTWSGWYGGSSAENARDRFVETKMTEHAQRRQRHGESVFLLEPDIKEGQGGLRDVHTAMWIARAKCGAVKLDDLPGTGLLEPGDATVLERGRDFLWRVRNELHLMAGRHQDRLTFESQERAARGLGYDGEGKLSEVETFMRAYYLHAEEVSRLSSLIIHRAVDHDPSQRRRLRPGRELRPEETMPAHYRLLRRLGDEPFLAAVFHHPEHGHSELAICAHDQPGLFASIAGVFAAMELNVLSARINTRRDGLILDVFRISHQDKAEVVMDPGKWSRMESALERVLKDQADVAELVGRSRPSLSQRPAVKVSTHVRWDNAASDDFTVIEVYTQDRPGVLFTITYLLSKLGFSIHLAKISTDVDRVADVFYVADAEGGKIRDEGRLEGLREALQRELDPKDDGRTRAAG